MSYFYQTERLRRHQYKSTELTLIQKSIMSASGDYIIHGPSVPLPFPSKHVGKLTYEILKNKNQDETILTNGVTGEKITYGRIFQASLNIATKIKNLAIKKGDPIAIVSENNWQYIAATYACFYLGVPVILLNPDYMIGELQHFFDFIKPKLIFCNSKSEATILALIHQELYAGPIFNIDSEDLLDGDAEDLEPEESDPQDLAFVMTSSGTTGFPKGVMISNENFLNTLHYSRELLGFNEFAATVAYMPFFHMFGSIPTLAGVLFGTRMVLLAKFQPEIFLRILQDHKITVLAAVPPILQFLVKTPLLEKYDISSVQEILGGAAKITKELEDVVNQRLNIPIRQLYGLTETSGAVTVMPRNVNRPGSVGKMCINTSGKVCNPETGKALPANQVGELRFKGKSIMLGYINDKDQTKNAFDEDGYLNSGDLGYYDEDGFFYIVDRLKEVIKYKGFQVSPAELETLLIQHPLVRDAGVVGIPDERAGEVPIAFVVKEEDGVTEEELVRYVEENISVQKRLYGGVRFVEEIPKSPSGKILRRRLKELL